MYQLILIFHVLVAVSVIALVLVQQGKGASMGAAFGSGASQTVFGSRGSGSFLFRLTLGLIVIFFTTSIVLNYIATKASKQSQQINLPANLPVSAPAVSAEVSPNSIPGAPPANAISAPESKTVSPNSIPDTQSGNTTTPAEKRK